METDDHNLSGKLLLAMPDLMGTPFARSVIYICVHSAAGAMGLIVNKYLPPRPKDQGGDIDVLAPYLTPVADTPKGLLGWVDKVLEKI